VEAEALKFALLSSADNLLQMEAQMVSPLALAYNSRAEAPIFWAPASI